MEEQQFNAAKKHIEKLKIESRDKHTVGHVPLLDEESLMKENKWGNRSGYGYGTSNHAWQIRKEIQESNGQILRDHYEFLKLSEDFQEKVVPFTSFFNSYYNIQFLQAEIFLTTIRDIYKRGTVSLNKAIMATMQGNPASLYKFIGKRNPEYNYFFDLLSCKSRIHYFSTQGILLNKPTDGVDMSWSFRSLNIEQMKEYWDFIQVFIQPKESPETMKLVKDFLLLCLENMTSNNKNQYKEFLPTIIEIVEFCKEHKDLIYANGKPIEIKRFDKALTIDTSQFKNTVISRILSNGWMDKDIQTQLTNIIAKYDKEFGSAITDERFAVQYFSSMSYKNQLFAEGVIRRFFTVQKCFSHRFENLKEIYGPDISNLTFDL
jgi:hypothetical protein